jgi:hypothetical protein
MRWVPDGTGRFPRRPHYDWYEIDEACERIVQAFLMRSYSKVRYPVHTNDLTKLVEEEADSLDLYADFEEERNLSIGLRHRAREITDAPPLTRSERRSSAWAG